MAKTGWELEKMYQQWAEDLDKQKIKSFKLRRNVKRSLRNCSIEKLEEELSRRWKERFRDPIDIRGDNSFANFDSAQINTELTKRKHRRAKRLEAK